MKNTLFLTQSGSLRLFASLRDALASGGEMARAGFYVTDSTHYSGFKAANPGFEGSADIVREWEILHRARSVRPDRARIAELERRYGETLWNAIVADRRLFLGANAVREQDYATRYSHDELLSIVLTASDAMEAQFDRVRPELVVGFICVTVGEYLAYLIAKHRGVPFVNLRPTRVRNYFYGGEDIFEPSAALEATYRRFRSAGIPEAALSTARDVLRDVRSSHAMYEGVLPAAGQRVSTGIQVAAANVLQEALPARLRRIVSESIAYRRGALSADNHRASKGAALWFNRVKKPWRVRAAARELGPRYVRDFAALGERGYAFFPLHKEPEVTLLVYGRPWHNQIEAVRNVARSLPVGMTLVVKEHPAAVGYRPIAYYRKLLDVPNVVLAAPEATSREVLRHAKLAAIIGGSVGLEALMLGIPVVALGNVPFSFLPDRMIRLATNPHEIDRVIATLLQRHGSEESALEAYVAAVVASSVPVDFYSVLLKRRGAYRPDRDADEYSVQMARLAEYVTRRSSELSLKAQPMSLARSAG